MEIKHLGQFIQYLATKAKVEISNETLKAFLANAELTKIAMPEDLFKLIDENLLSIDAALDAHPQVKNKYTAQALNPFDTRMQEMLDELELDDAGKEEIKGIRSSYKRFEVLTAKIKELAAAKKDATGKTDKDALQKQIDELQASLKKAKDDVVAKESEYKEQLNKDKIDFRLRNALAEHKTIFDALPSDVRNSTIKNLIDSYLAENDAEVRFDEKGDLQPFKKDGSKLYGANHTLTDLKGMIEGVLAKNKILQVADSANGGQQNNDQKNNGGTGTTTVIAGGNGQEPAKIHGTNQTVMNLNSAAIAAIESQK